MSREFVKRELIVLVQRKVWTSYNKERQMQTCQQSCCFHMDKQASTEIFERVREKFVEIRRSIPKRQKFSFPVSMQAGKNFFKIYIYL